MGEETTVDAAPRPRRAFVAGRARGWLRRAIKAGAIGAGVFFGGSVLWVGAVGLFGPGETHLMARERDRLGAVEHAWTPIEEIAPNLRRAALAAEDARFCAHWGVDIAEIRRALARFERGGPLRGASTITQQTAKNVFLWPERAWLRKGAEVYFTLLIEALWSKERTLEIYLNVAEFGPGVFGAEAAAQRAFNRSAADLTLWQASNLAAVLPAPRRRDAARPTEALAARSAQIAQGADDLAVTDRAACVGG